MKNRSLITKIILLAIVAIVVITILCGVGGFVFIALALNGLVKTDIKETITNVSRETLEDKATKKINKMIKNGQLEASNKEEYIKREIKHQKKREKKRGVK